MHIDLVEGSAVGTYPGSTRHCRAGDVAHLLCGEGSWVNGHVFKGGTVLR